MILIKQVSVFLNVVHGRFKQYVADKFKENNINLTPEQFLVIDTLWKKDAISQQQLADIIMKDKNSVTKLIDAMEKKHLLIRIPDNNDRRLNLIALTDKGKALEKPLTEIAIQTVNSIIEGISPEDLVLFVEVLNKMSDNMNIKHE